MTADLAATHFAYARSLARKYARRLRLDEDEAIGDGLLGLTEAARRYKPDNGYPFTAYAHPYITGRIIDAHRRSTSYQRSTRLAPDQPVSLDDLRERLAGDDSLLATDTSGDIADLLHARQALRRLPPHERRLLILLAAGYAGRELAHDQGVHESRISQLAKAARDRARRELAA